MERLASTGKTSMETLVVIEEKFTCVPVLSALALWTLSDRPPNLTLLTAITFFGSASAANLSTPTSHSHTLKRDASYKGKGTYKGKGSLQYPPLITRSNTQNR
jgi:hypothetical protein